MRSVADQGFRFLLAGALATGVHVLIAVTLIELAGAAPVGANGAAFAAATVFSYLVNSRWTFRAPLAASSLARFVVVALAGLALTLVITAAVQRSGYHYLAGIAAVVLLVPPFSFVSHRYWTYRA